MYIPQVSGRDEGIGSQTVAIRVVQPMSNSSTQRCRVGAQWIILLYMSFIYQLGCREEKYSVHYVIPNDYCGVFVVRPGLDDYHTDSLKNAIVINVPRDGVICAKDITFLTRWHVTTAAFDSGKQITVLDSAPAAMNSDDICLKMIATDADGVTYFYVGSRSEIAEYEADGFNLRKVPPGSRIRMSAP